MTLSSTILPQPILTGGDGDDGGDYDDGNYDNGGFFNDTVKHHCLNLFSTFKKEEEKKRIVICFILNMYF